MPVPLLRYITRVCMMACPYPRGIGPSLDAEDSDSAAVGPCTSESSPHASVCFRILPLCTAVYGSVMPLPVLQVVLLHSRPESLPVGSGGGLSEPGGAQGLEGRTSGLHW